MDIITDLDHPLAQAIAHNARTLTGDRMLEALADDSDRLPADLIRTGRAQAALRLAREAAPEQELTVHRASPIGGRPRPSPFG